MLAMKLGYASPAAMLREMRPGELGTWMALQHEWGEERGDMRSGIVASTLANVHRGKGAEAFTFRDFMPQFYGQEGGAGVAEKLKNFLRGFVKKKG